MQYIAMTGTAGRNENRSQNRNKFIYLCCYADAHESWLECTPDALEWSLPGQDPER